MTTYAPEAQVRQRHAGGPLFAVVGLLALVLAGVVGYAAGGGLTGSPSVAQEISDKVMKAWATGDAASVAAAYDPKADVVLVYDRTEDVVASNRNDILAAIRIAIGAGNTYRQIGPVAAYEAADGDTYVSTMVEVKGPGHQDGDPLVGFYRLHDGKVTTHVFMDAVHY